MFTKIIRFIEIDLQYLKTSLPFWQKIFDIIRTNSRLLINIVGRKKIYSPVLIGGNKIFYDTPFATKTLLTTIYDFYTETKRASIIQKKPVILDIGANIGQFIVAVKSFYPEAVIYSCEPDEDVFKILKKNALNYKNVKVYNYGLSNKSGQSVFYKSEEFSEWSGLKPLDGHKYSKTQIDLRQGDQLFKSIKLIDLIKIDVEGAELEVLKGMKNIISRSKYILLEASILRSPVDVGSKKVLLFLFEHNFSLNHVGRIFSDNTGNYQGAVDILLKNDKYE